MKKTLMASAAVFALAVGANAATLTFDTLSVGNGYDVTFDADGGQVVTGTGHTASTSSWVMQFTNLDILGDGGAYDGTITIGVTTSDSGLNVNDNGSTSRFRIGGNETLTLTGATLVLSDSVGSMNENLASSLNVSFGGFTRTFDAGGLGAGNTGGTYTGEGITTPIVIDTDPVEIPGGTLNLTANTTRSANLFGIGGDFTVTAVPEPSSAALLGLGGLALILRRRK